MSGKLSPWVAVLLETTSLTCHTYRCTRAKICRPLDPSTSIHAGPEEIDIVCPTAACKQCPLEGEPLRAHLSPQLERVRCDPRSQSKCPALASRPGLLLQREIIRHPYFLLLITAQSWQGRILNCSSPHRGFRIQSCPTHLLGSR